MCHLNIAGLRNPAGIPSVVRKLRRKDSRIALHTCVHSKDLFSTSTGKRTRTRTYAHAHTRARTHTHAHAHALAHARTRTRTRTRTHTHTHTHSHMHMHTRACARGPVAWSSVSVMRLRCAHPSRSAASSALSDGTRAG
eukprot:6192203-Pleurochrysis_carterae.AAC.2